MNKNALIFDKLTADEMNILLSELHGEFPHFSLISKHQDDWQSCFKEAMENIGSYEADYDPPRFLRENWPTTGPVWELVNFPHMGVCSFDVLTKVNSSFLWLISFWYCWDINFIAYSCADCSKDIATKFHALAINALDFDLELNALNAYDSVLTVFEDMDMVGAALDFYLTGDMGGDDPFRPILFCKQSEVVERLKNHPVFGGRCDYYSREEYLKDPLLNPLRLQLPPEV
ncbi:hypothetical protein [Comamonas sediminis]|uniref:Uncharacterized protein n=1 Tax=Comamonas sediminis TaxID=1783360 RepID=A0ABV4B3E1_9BURK